MTHTEPVAPLPAAGLLQCCFAVEPAAAPGSYPITDQCEAVDEFGNLVPVTCGPGAITIEEPTPPPSPSETPAATETGTVTHTPSPTWIATTTVTSTPTIMPTPTATGPPASTCVGNCDDDEQVTVDELVKGVNIALGSLLLSDCPSFDTDDSGTVTVDELVRAVNNALIGCGG
ncbi:MAG: hypothetical protein HY699_20375 [Deltaproteobacteria bacterium]|nr:hypothetical protein [Deltaproteobacteria bacterium]